MHVCWFVFGLVAFLFGFLGLYVHSDDDVTPFGFGGRFSNRHAGSAVEWGRSSAEWWRDDVFD